MPHCGTKRFGHHSTSLSFWQSRCPGAAWFDSGYVFLVSDPEVDPESGNFSLRPWFPTVTCLVSVSPEAYRKSGFWETTMGNFLQHFESDSLLFFAGSLEKYKFAHMSGR